MTWLIVRLERSRREMWRRPRRASAPFGATSCRSPAWRWPTTKRPPTPAPKTAQSFNVRLPLITPHRIARVADVSCVSCVACVVCVWRCIIRQRGNGQAAVARRSGAEEGGQRKKGEQGEGPGQEGEAADEERQVQGARGARAGDRGQLRWTDAGHRRRRPARPPVGHPHQHPDRHLLRPPTGRHRTSCRLVCACHVCACVIDSTCVVSCRVVFNRASRSDRAVRNCTARRPMRRSRCGARPRCPMSKPCSDTRRRSPPSTAWARSGLSPPADSTDRFDSSRYAATAHASSVARCLG